MNPPPVKRDPGHPSPPRKKLPRSSQTGCSALQKGSSDLASYGKGFKAILSAAIEDEQPRELYDFLYRDQERIASYYAQIWNGRLLSVEEVSSESEQSEEGLKGDVKVAAVESKISSAYQFQNTRTLDMHDAATVDLLLRLTAQRAERGIMGSIRAFSGTCFFLDRNILKFAGPAIELAAQQRPSRQQQKNQSRRNAPSRIMIKEWGRSRILLPR